MPEILWLDPFWPLFCFDDDGMPLWQCNDCGRLVPIWNDLCGPCGYEEELRERAA